MSKNEKQIKELIHQYMNDMDKEKRKKIFNELKTYGNIGINAISELIKITGSDDLIVYGLGIINDFKDHNVSKDT